VSSFKGLSHDLKTSLGVEVVGITEDGLLFLAESLSDIIDRVNSCNINVGVGDDNAILNVEALDCNEVTRSGTGVSNKLSDDGEQLGGIDSHSWTVESGITHTVGVEIATICVANTSVSVAVSVTARSISSARSQSCDGARMRSVGGGDGVSFPQVHL